MSDNTQHLFESCRALRVLLSSPTPPALKVAAPKIAEALPLVRLVLAGLEDLVDRVAMLEIAIRERGL